MNEANPKPIFEYADDSMRVRSYGNGLQWNPQESPGEEMIHMIESLAEAQGLNRVVWH